MPLYTPDTERTTALMPGDIPAGFGDVMEAQFASTVTELPTVAGKRLWDLQAARATGPKLGVEEAQARIREAGMEGLLAADDGLTESALDILIERKRDEVRRNTTLSRGRGGFVEGAARLGVALGTSLADPVNVASAFIPIVGEARYLRLLKNATRVGRVGVRAGVGAVEGAAGAALIEPLIYTAKQQEQADYDMADSLLNIAFGTIFGGGLHVVGGTSAEAIRSLRGLEQPWERPRTDAGRVLAEVNRQREITPAAVERNTPELSERLDTALEIGAERPGGAAAEAVEAATPEVRQEALATAVGQMADGRPVEVDVPVTRADVLPERFQPETVRERAAELVETVDRQVQELTAPLKGAEPPPRVAAHLAELAERRAALEALQRGEPLTPPQAEQVRRAAVSDAVGRGEPVPERALDGADQPTAERAATLRGEATEATARRAAETEAATARASEETAAAVDEEVNAAPDPDEAPDAIAEELAAAEQELAAVAKRFDVEPEDEAMRAAAQFEQDAERWSRIAKAATACLMRDG